MSPVDVVTRSLATKGCKPQKSTTGYSALCPAHDDHNPSLSIAEGQDGRVLLKCHAGCLYDEILACLGITSADLFPNVQADRSPTSTITATYDYKRSDGSIAFQVVRYIPKTFKLRHPDGNGTWKWSLKDLTHEDRILPYRLPEVLDAISRGYPATIVEGEKDADAIAQVYPGATCNAGGAGKFTAAHARHLVGASSVLIICDRDTAGYKHGLAVLEACKQAGFTGPIYIYVADCEDGCKDASDLIGRHGEAWHESARYLEPDELDERSKNETAEIAYSEKLAPEAFYGLAGEIVRMIEPESEADPSALLLTFLTAFGAAVGGSAYMLADGAKHTARLFVVLVGLTSKGRKGTSWAQIKRVMQVADPTFMEECILSGFGSGESLIDAAAENKEDHRILVLESEFASPLAVASRDGATLSQHLRNAWDGSRLESRSRKNGVVRAEGAYIAAIGHITMDELRNKLNAIETANGFANRHLFVSVQRSKLLPSGGNLEDDEIQRLGEKVRKALDTARTIGLMHRSFEAEKHWDKLYRTLAEDEPGGLLGSIIARDVAHILRLSIIYALLDGSSTIEPAHLDAARSVWDFCRQSAERIFGGLTGNPVAEQLLSVIKSAGEEGLTLTQQSRAFNGHVSADRLKDARSVLLANGSVRVEQDTTSGRPIERWIATCEKRELSEKSPSLGETHGLNSLNSQDMQVNVSQESPGQILNSLNSLFSQVNVEHDTTSGRRLPW
ncbi:MAG: DUF3987 domain-containing protein [Acidimicrobiales bacterium]